MSRMHRWVKALALVYGLTGSAHAAETAWTVPAPAAPQPGAVTLGRPVPMSGVTLDRPVAIGGGSISPVTYDPTNPGPVVRGQSSDSLPPVGLPTAPVLAGLPPVGLTTSTSYQGPPPPPPPGTGAPVVPPTYGPLPGTEQYNPSAAVNQPLNHSWTDTVGGWFGELGGPNHFCSNVCPGDFASPVSNPFFFEDPRALTEIKPLFLYQGAPDHTPVFRGGDAVFFGVQGRLAITDHWSIVLNKFGIVSLHAKDAAEDPTGNFQSSSTGFAEVNFGPKYTFFHSEDYGALALGLNLELPIGSTRDFQNVGTLGLDPYVSYGVGFLRSSYGKFGFVTEGGYSFAADSQRAQFFHGSMHLDYNILNLDKFFPLVELNYFHYTNKGNDNDLPFEGTDLVNFGSDGITHKNYTQLALGMRYKFSENIQVGGTIEFPLENKDIELYRLTLDIIFRF